MADLQVDNLFGPVFGMSSSRSSRGRRDLGLGNLSKPPLTLLLPWLSVLGACGCAQKECRLELCSSSDNIRMQKLTIIPFFPLWTGVRWTCARYCGNQSSWLNMVIVMNIARQCLVYFKILCGQLGKNGSSASSGWIMS